jgi:hypothetical protein
MNIFRCLRPVVIFGLYSCAIIAARGNLNISTPHGLNPGDQFRIVFLTQGVTQATNPNIGYYNTFVNNDASSQAGGNGSNVVYNTTALTWSAIGSTYEISAISNIGSFGVPVYLASGTLITPSDTSSGLWSGSPLAPINQFLTGSGSFGTGVWTGTLPNGTSAGSFTLGNSGGMGVVPGMSEKSDLNWVETPAVPENWTNNMYWHRQTQRRHRQGLQFLRIGPITCMAFHRC